MRVSVTFRHIEPTAALRRYAEEKAARVAKHLRRPLEAHVVLEVMKHLHIAEVTLVADRTTLAAREETDDLYSAIDLAMDKVERQAEKHKVRRRTLGRAPAAARRNSGDEEPAAEEEVAGPGETTATVIRSERVPRPMSVEDAVLHLQHTRDEFVVFRNEATWNLSVLYRRRDGNFGLIEAETGPSRGGRPRPG